MNSPSIPTLRQFQCFLERNINNVFVSIEIKAFFFPTSFLLFLQKPEGGGRERRGEEGQRERRVKGKRQREKKKEKERKESMKTKEINKYRERKRVEEKRREEKRKRKKGRKKERKERSQYRALPICLCNVCNVYNGMKFLSLLVLSEARTSVYIFPAVLQY